MEMVGKVLLGIVMLFAAALVSAYTLSSLWLLFIVPLGVIPIGIAHAYGISLLVSMFKINPYKKSKEPMTFELFTTGVFVVVFISLVALGLGHFAALFM